jgi:hypothetical protein
MSKVKFVAYCSLVVSAVRLYASVLVGAVSFLGSRLVLSVKETIEFVREDYAEVADILSREHLGAEYADWHAEHEDIAASERFHAECSELDDEAMFV